MPLISEGNAAPGFPLSGAALRGDELVLVSRNLNPVRYAVIDVDTWSLVRTETLARGDGAWGTTTAPDGIWMGLFGAIGQGNLMRMAGGGPQGRAALGTQYIWDLASDDSDVVFGVGTNPTLVFSVRRSTGHASDLGVVTNPAQRPRTCAIVGQRVLFAGAESGKAWIRHTDRSGRDGRTVVPPAIAQDDIVYCSAALPDGRVAVGTGGDGLATPAVAVFGLDDSRDAMVVRLPRESLVDTVAVEGTTVWATARPSGALYRIDAGTGDLRRVAVPVPMSETRELFLRGTLVIGASADGSVWTHDRSDNTVERHTPTDLGLVSRAQKPQSVLATSTHTDVGGSFSITRHDRSSSVATTRFVPGEPKAMVDVDGTTFMAMYPIAEIWCWPPEEAYPRRLTQLPNDQLRPIDLVYADRIDALAVSTTDDRSHSAVHTVDPVTGRVDTMFDPLGLGQTASGLHISGTTLYVGGSSNAPDVAAFDILSGNRLWQVTDVAPGGSFVLGLAAVGNTLVVSTATGWLARIDLRTRQVVQRRRFANEAGRMRLAGNRVLLVNAEVLVDVNPTTLATTVLEGNLDAEVWGWPPLDVDRTGRAWLIRGRELVHT